MPEGLGFHFKDARTTLAIVDRRSSRHMGCYRYECVVAILNVRSRRTLLPGGAL